MPKLIGPDVKSLRKRYDEALKLQGIPAWYQYPVRPEVNNQSESVVDLYSAPELVYIFFESSPKVTTFKRLGWVVENNKDLPFLIDCSFNLPNVQKDCIFKFAGLYSGLPDREFRVTEIGYSLSAADHLTCQVVPVYDKNTVGKTAKEVESAYSTSHTFLKRPTDYRGDYYDPESGGNQ